MSTSTLETTVSLNGGLEVELEPLKTRQAFALFRIILRGTHQGNLLLTMIGQDDPDEILGKIIMSAIFSVPDAEDEAIGFLQSIVRPIHAEQENQVRDYLENPSLDDLVTIFHALAVREAPHVSELGRRLAAMIQLAGKTGQTK